MIKNQFYQKVHEAESACATVPELETLLGRARAKKGMFEGDLNEGELEIGEISSIIKEIKPASNIVAEVWQEFKQAALSPFSG